MATPTGMDATLDLAPGRPFCRIPSNPTPRDETPPSALSTFVELLASDTTWRSKVLKLVQYVSRALIVAHRESRPSYALQLLLSAALPLPRLRLLAQSISLARRMLYVGETLVYVRDALAEVGWGRRPSLALVARPSALAAITYVLAGIGEDVSIASKIGLLDPASLPAFFPRFVEVTWALQCCWYAYFAGVKLIAAQRACAAAERGAAAASDARAKPSQRAASLVALKAARHERFLAVLNALKCAADCAQSLPYALGWASFPEVLEVQAGLWSGIFNAYRAWHAARTLQLEPPAPSAEDDDEEEEAGEDAGGAAGISDDPATAATPLAGRALPLRPRGPVASPAVL